MAGRRETISIVTCPHHPYAEVIEDYHAGDLICQECGLVVGDRVIDVSTEWRTFGSDSDKKGPEKCRIGATENPLLSNNDLCTVIERTNYFSGNPIRSTLSSTDAMLRRGFVEIDNLAARLNLPTAITQRTKIIFKQVRENKSVKNHMSGVVAACVFIACRQEIVPRSFKEICAASGHKKKEIGHCFRVIEKELLINMQVVSTEDFMSRFCANLELPLHIQKTATFIAKKAVELDIVMGKSPVSVAGAAIYMTSQATRDKRSLKEICEISGVTDYAIRQAYKVMYHRCYELFPLDFKFYIPIDSLPEP